MQNRLRLAVIVALFFGLIAAYGISNFLRQQRLVAEEFRKATQDVVVAAKEILPGTPITNDMVKSTLYLKTSIPPGSFSSSQQLTGKISRVKIAVGEPLLESRLGEKTGLTVLLTPGHRAIAVRVNEVVGVSGFIAPNDHVDVIAHVTYPPIDAAPARQISKIVLQNKRVLSVAQNTERKGGEAQVASTITLELTPEEAEKLSVASLEGQIVLALRATQDNDVVHTQGSTTRDLLNIAAPRPTPTPIRVEPPPLPSPPPAKYRVAIYEGSKRSDVEF